MTDYNDGNWHGWNGGECPVHPKSRVQWSRHTGIGSFGVSHQGEAPALHAPWISIDGDGHLVAFRVVAPYAEPREWWLDELTCRTSPVDCGKPRPEGCILVREVKE